MLSAAISGGCYAATSRATVDIDRDLVVDVFDGLKFELTAAGRNGVTTLFRRTGVAGRIGSIEDRFISARIAGERGCSALLRPPQRAWPDRPAECGIVIGPKVMQDLVKYPLQLSSAH
ncbi:MAG: hypothetical protein R2849_12280 [Thermomicrobiales bacterium]